MWLALAIIASIIFAEAFMLVSLMMTYDGLEGIEIWLGLNKIILTVGAIALIIAGIITLWMLAL